MAPATTTPSTRGREPHGKDPRDAEPTAQEHTRVQTFRWKPRKLKKDGTPFKPRRGWGPYGSVPNERSVAFNLQLDVQNLQQDVQNLTALRGILRTKSLVQRHSPEGSLTKLVNEYLYVFRKGVVPRERVDDRDQRAFMRSVMDEEVDMGYGLCGPDAIMDQMANYSTFLRFICLTGQVDNIVVAEDSVLISDRASFRFQVTRSTIELVFPHILSNACLVSQLVGQEIEAQGRSTFHFNAAGKCFRYDVEMDFVGAFTRVVKDPHVVNLLLGRALITENAMIGVIDEPVEDEEKAPTAQPLSGLSKEDTRSKKGCAKEPSALATKNITASSDEFCQRIVDTYFSAFAKGYHDAPSEVPQRDFFQNRFTLQAQTGAETIVDRMRNRWRALCACFQLLEFYQHGRTHTDYDNRNNLCRVEPTARYVLRITMRTIRSVFPHVVSRASVLGFLVGKELTVPSTVAFTIEKRTGRISNVYERMDFTTPLAGLVRDRHELAFVLSSALFVEDGVDSSRMTVSPVSFQGEHPHFDQTWGIRRDTFSTSSRTMSIADLLS